MVGYQVCLGEIRHSDTWFVRCVYVHVLERPEHLCTCFVPAHTEVQARLHTKKMCFGSRHTYMHAHDVQILDSLMYAYNYIIHEQIRGHMHLDMCYRLPFHNYRYL
jgi:hypothetical protein